jgi:glutamine synthetase
MQREKLIFVGTSDLSGHFRGKAFPASDLVARAERGMGQPPTNIMLSAFGPIHATPFGTAGENALIPDLSTRVDVWFGDEDAGESFVIGDLKTAEGAYWECCPRNFLRRALDALYSEFGLTVLAAFEQEFYLPAVPVGPAASFRLESLRRTGIFGEALLGALRAAGLEPDSFVPEYAAGQYEVTVAPKRGLRAADDAVIVREMIRAVAWRLAQPVTIAPLLTPDGVGSGTHIHFSLFGADNIPILPDSARPHGLSERGEHFVAGIQTFLPALVALTAPSVPSYFRLRPNKWAPTTSDLATSDRGAALRLCPSASPDPATAARRFNVEFRVADATASPYLALGAVLHAGLEGLRRRLTLPVEAAPLPQSLNVALDLLQSSGAAKTWLGPQLHAIYLQLKRAEIAALETLSDAEICHRYTEVY